MNDQLQEPRAHPDQIDLSASLAELLRERFRPISLPELDDVRLMDRTETKVLVPVSELGSVIAGAGDEYRILEIEGRQTQRYVNEYFDSPGLQTYLDHHNQVGSRFKVRYRTYVESDLTFFEVKQNDRGRIVKTRRRALQAGSSIATADVEFAQQITGVDVGGFVPSVCVAYERILLASVSLGERVTIDLATSFDASAGAVQTRGLAICEFKQERLDRTSPLMQSCRSLGFYPRSMSKYCTGIASCTPDVRANRFKRTFRQLEKIGVAFEQIERTSGVAA